MDYSYLTDLIFPILGIVLAFFYIKDSRFKKIVDIIRKAVQAVEQMDKAGILPLPKKEAVIKFAREKGVKLSDEELEVIIESLVYELNLEKKKIGEK